MKENIQINLFFGERQIYDPLRVCNDIANEIDILGQPVILPFNIGAAPDDENVPVAIFNQSSEMQMNLTFNLIGFTLFNRDYNNLEKIIKSLYKIIKKYDLHIARIGYVNNLLMSEDMVDNFKKEKFLDSSIIESEDFEIAWYKKIKLNNELTANYWQRYATNNSVTNKLFVTYDVNTFYKEKLDVTEKFVINFIKHVNKFLDL